MSGSRPSTENLLEDTRQNARRLLAELQIDRAELLADHSLAQSDIAEGLTKLQNVIDSAQTLADALDRI